jgi:hypothetical protein
MRSLEGLSERSKAMEHVPRETRLLALSCLLDYALAEIEELGLAHLDKLLGAAALAVNDELDAARTLSNEADGSSKRPPPKR